MHDNLPSWKEGFTCHFDTVRLCFANYIMWIIAYTGCHTFYATQRETK
ncbi:acetyltransferase [Enterobacter hormaechei ATCC 49162]|nr:acetyltransferase [Enterobacter hormaechei ATCC 49162]